MQSREDIAREAIVAVREIIRRAILTMVSLPDREARFVGYATLPANVVHDAREAYGYSAPRARGFRPSAEEISQVETVDTWLAWLRREEGEEAIRRLFAWALGAPAWRLGDRERCSERTVLNRIERSVAAIIREFAGTNLSVEVVDEPQDAPVSQYVMLMEKSPGPHGHVKLAKVFIYDVGFVKNGKVWRDGSDRLRKAKLHLPYPTAKASLR